MLNPKDTLRSLMKEVNINPRIQDELLTYASSGKSFPYIPKNLINIHCETDEAPTTVVFRLPPRPIQRPQKTIEALGGYERDQFRPSPAKTRSSFEKQRLQNLMAYGKDIEEELRSNINSEETSKEENEKIDLFSEIVREIKERQEFLDDMIALGEGKKYLPEIQCQIALRFRELEKIDKERAKQFIHHYGFR